MRFSKGAELTSYYSAGNACYFVNNYPGSVSNTLQDAYDIWDNRQPVTGLQNNHVGFKYFNFEHYTAPGNNTHFDLYLTPRTASAFSVDIMIGSPWAGVRGGTVIGRIDVPAGSVQAKTKFSVPVPAVDQLGKKHAIYLRVSGGAGNIWASFGRFPTVRSV